ncbi:hypothetical protein TMU01_15260 [Tenuibacillus multivorans]|nr:hypothetical protein TMU01_15260 [Tenuibacillus multivorans]
MPAESEVYFYCDDYSENFVKTAYNLKIIDTKFFYGIMVIYLTI